MTPADSPTPIDRVFKRLAGTYLAAWDRTIGATPIADVKTVWAHELSGFLQSRQAMRAIAWALEHLPERCPNAIEFRNLCRQAPPADLPQLPAPAADPERVAAELDKLAPLRVLVKGQGPVDHKAWAHKLIARHGCGGKVASYPLRIAREALGLPTDRVHA